MCSLSDIRRAFDNISDRDGCIGPFQLRELLQYLRGPAPIEEAEVEEVNGIVAMTSIIVTLRLHLCFLFQCLMTLGSTSDESVQYPRIAPIVFERWYKLFYNIYDDDEEQGEKQGQGGGIVHTSSAATTTNGAAEHI